MNDRHTERQSQAASLLTPADGKLTSPHFVQQRPILACQMPIQQLEELGHSRTVCNLTMPSDTALQAVEPDTRKPNLKQGSMFWTFAVIHGACIFAQAQTILFFHPNRSSMAV